MLNYYSDSYNILIKQMRIGNKKYSQTKIPTRSQQPINNQYLNCIRKNHLEFQHQEKFNSQILTQINCKNASANSFNMLDYDRKEHGKLREVTVEDEQEVDKKDNELSSFEQQLIKNYKTIDVMQSNSHQKYRNLGQSTIIPTKRATQLHVTQPNSNQEQILSQKMKSSIDQLKQEIKSKLILQNHQSQHYNNSQNQQTRHFETQTQRINDEKTIQQMKLFKINTNNDQSNKPPLLMKKQKVKDLWKEKFLNWNEGNLSVNRKVEKKSLQSDIKFPSIKITKMENKQRAKSKTQELKTKKNNEIQLYNCKLIKSSKPKLIKYNNNHHHHPQVFVENKSFPVVVRTQDEVDSFIKKHIESGLMMRGQSSHRSYQSSSKSKNSQHATLQNTSSILQLSPSQISIMNLKRQSGHNVDCGSSYENETITLRENHRQHQTWTEHKNKFNNYKQLVRQKQKQVERYLLQNVLLKSVVFVNQQEKQEEKNKILFEEKQKVDVTERQHCVSIVEKKSANMKRVQTREKVKEEVLETKQQIAKPVNNQPTVAIDNNPEGPKIQNPSNTINSLASPVQKKKTPNLTSLRKDYDLSIYEMKILSYQEFIFMMNLSHKVIINVTLKPASQAKTLPKYTYFIGMGNNRLLIKSLMNRRYWWQQTKDMNKANFVWTQLKVNELYRYEKISQYGNSENMFDKLEVKQESKVKISHKKKRTTIKNQLKSISYKAPLPENNQLKIFTKCDKEIYDNMIQKLLENADNIINLNLNNRLKFLPTQRLNVEFTEETLRQQRVHNHFEFNYFIGNKKALFYNLQNYYHLLGKDVFQIIPYTLHIKKGMQDHAYKTFLKQYNKIAKQGQSLGMRNIWIVKPGQLSNRGQGITVIDQVYELNNILKKKQKHKNGCQKSYILQRYIQKPLLYKNRKFDIRHYVLLTRFHGRFRAYFYGQGYIRTSSHQFNLDELDEMIHLTNDAIQKQGEQYGKHEDGNKVSYSQFQRYLDSVYGENKHSFADDIYPRMKSIAVDTVKATYGQLDPMRLEHNFELLGLDFMIDNKFNLWLIQVNTNPCLQLSSKLLERLIPQMAEHSLRLCIDPMFPPPAQYPNSLKHLCPDSPLERMQYELIFDQAKDGQQLQQLFKKSNLKQLYSNMGEVDEQDATFQNDGIQIELKNQKNDDNP